MARPLAVRGTANAVSRCSRIVIGKTTTFVGALGITAPMVLDGLMDGLAFEAYVTQVLAPTIGPGDIVVIDNPAAHKRAEVAIPIEAAGARLLYLPPYSPELNPSKWPSPSRGESGP
jgi:hypothetical protein